MAGQEMQTTKQEQAITRNYKQLSERAIKQVIKGVEGKRKKIAIPGELGVNASITTWRRFGTVVDHS